MAELFERPGLVVMLSPIDGNRHVGWDVCAQCGRHIKHCPCAHGPKEPDYIKRWRGEQVDEPRPIETATGRSLDAIEVDF